jgi:hypothetical protein
VVVLGVEDVDVGAAEERVRAAVADERVLATAAEERGMAAAAGERVVAVAAEEEQPRAGKRPCHVICCRPLPSFRWKVA